MNIKELIQCSTISETSNNGCRVRLDRSVSSTEYAEFKKVVEMAGGQYINVAHGHSFDTPPDITKARINEYADRVMNNKTLNKEEFFPTPDHIADKLISDMALYDQYTHYVLSGQAQNPPRVLEPSAGDGALIDAMLRANPEFNGEIVAIEIDPLRAQALRDKYADKAFIVNVLEDDFMTLDRDTIGEFDFALINPPFQEWVPHLEHAKSLLKTNNSFVAAILPNLDAIISKTRDTPEKRAAIDIKAYGNTPASLVEGIDAGEFNKHKKRGQAHKTSVSTSSYITSPANERGISKEIAELAALGLENDSNFYKRHIQGITNQFEGQEGPISHEQAEKLLDTMTSAIQKEQTTLLKEGQPVAGDIRNIAGRLIIGELDVHEFDTQAIFDIMHDKGILPFYDVKLYADVPGINFWEKDENIIGPINNVLNDFQEGKMSGFSSSVDDENNHRAQRGSNTLVIETNIQALGKQDAVDRTRRLASMDDNGIRYSLVNGEDKKELRVWNAAVLDIRTIGREKTKEQSLSPSP